MRAEASGPCYRTTRLEYDTFHHWAGILMMHNSLIPEFATTGLHMTSNIRRLSDIFPDSSMHRKLMPGVFGERRIQLDT